MRTNRTPRPGSTLPVVVVMLVVLTGMLGFAIDIGYVAHARTALQSAADAAALAGAGELYSGARPTLSPAAGRAGVNAYAGGSAGNAAGLAVPDSDIEFGYFDPAGTVGSRFTTALGSNSPNAARVTLRRDGAANPRLALFFAPVLGRDDNDVRARATAWVPVGLGVLPNAELIPYAAHVDYFNAAAGRPARPNTSPGFVSVSGSAYPDNFNVGLAGTAPVAGTDGVKELVLFGSDKKAPGNFGSVDLGTASNGTPELARQLRYGPNAADFAVMQAAGKLAADGSLRAPVSLGGDTGISNGVKDDWAAIVGLNRIIPLYDTLTGNGNNASYRVVGFAGVRIVKVDLQGNPKQVWVQPNNFYSTRVTAQPASNSGGMIGVFAPPRLVIP